MNLTQLVYTSVLTALPMEIGQVVQAIAARSDENNRAVGITGCLLVDGRRVVQFLEGEPDAVATLAERIQADQRHVSYRVLFQGESERRQIPEWGMVMFRVDSSDVEESDLHELTARAQYNNPFDLNQFLVTMRSYLFDA